MKIDFSIILTHVRLIKPLPPYATTEQGDLFARVAVGDVGTIKSVRLTSTCFPGPLAVFDNGFTQVWVAEEHIEPA
jgi:hypothetical protein